MRFVPTPAMLAGDFTPIASAACNTGGRSRCARRSSDNRIDPALFSPAALPRRGQAADDDRPLRPTSASPTRRDDLEHQAIGKVDFQITQNHSLFGRYLARRSTSRRL